MQDTDTLSFLIFIFNYTLHVWDERTAEIGERMQSVPQSAYDIVVATVTAESEELVIAERGGWRGLEKQ